MIGLWMFVVIMIPLILTMANGKAGLEMGLRIDAGVTLLWLAIWFVVAA